MCDRGGGESPSSNSPTPSAMVYHNLAQSASPSCPLPLPSSPSPSLSHAHTHSLSLFVSLCLSLAHGQGGRASTGVKTRLWRNPNTSSWAKVWTDKRRRRTETQRRPFPLVHSLKLPPPLPPRPCSTTPPPTEIPNPSLPLGLARTLLSSRLPTSTPTTY